MNELQSIINSYLEFCKNQKRLDSKTLKAYRIDLSQLSSQITAEKISSVTVDVLEAYISTLHQTYKPKTAKRKIASINRAILEPTCIKQSRKYPFYQHFRDSIRYSNSACSLLLLTIFI